MVEIWLVVAVVVAVAAVLVLAFHRRLIRDPDRRRGPLVAGALIVLVLAVVLVFALLPEL